MQAFESIDCLEYNFVSAFLVVRLPHYAATQHNSWL